MFINLKIILLNSAFQIISIFGLFFIFGYLLYRIQLSTQNNYQKSIGWKGILWTGWIGTPIHELSHALFAWIFRHKIEGISLFKPDKTTGMLGHVNHSYSKFSLYQRIGNFFVGAAPLIAGPIFLVALLYILIPNAKQIFIPITQSINNFQQYILSLVSTYKIFAVQNIISWKCWLFLYLSFCVSSHMAPSIADLKNMWRGFFWIVIIVMIANIILFMIGISNTVFQINELFLIFKKTQQYLGFFTVIFSYALVISAIHYIFSVFLKLIMRK
jgi:hypothetical protein